MLDWFVHRLEPAVHHKVLKDNPSTFSYICTIAKKIGWLDDYLKETPPSAHAFVQQKSKCNSIQHNDPIGYAPI